MPDGRSVVHIPTYVGGTATTLRLASWWDNDNDNRDANGFATPNGIPDGFDNLMRRLNLLYDRGFRRFEIKLPAGDPDIDLVSGRKMSSAQWWTMPKARRDEFEGLVKDWIDEKATNGDPVEMGVYMGYHVNDPCDLDMAGADLFDTAFDALDESDPTDAAVIEDMMCRFKQNIQPWIDTGFTAFWFDNSGPSDLRTMLLKLANNPDYNMDAKFGGEAVPTNAGGSCAFPFDSSPILRGAWVETFAVAEYRHPNVTVSADSELHLWMSGHYNAPCGSMASAYGWDFEALERYYDNGWILDPEMTIAGLDVWSAGYASCNREYYSRKSDGYVIRNDGGGSGFLNGVEAAQRILDAGYIAAVADFNGDGKIEVDPSGLPGARDDDLLMFYTRWYQSFYYGSSGHRFVDGDVDNDGDVDMDDYDYFVDAANDYLAFRSISANDYTEYTAPTAYRQDLGMPD